MALILCVETATSACSVALSLNGKPIASKHSGQKNAHSAALNLFIDEVMQESGYMFSDLHALAVSKGPGSYTGLRIGVSTTKGLSYALDIPVIAPDSLLCMAAGFTAANREIQAEALLCPMIDARRMEVFAAVYDQGLQALLPVNAVIVNDGSFNGLPQGRPVFFFGDGSEKCREALSPRHNWIYFPGFVNSATHMAGLAEEYFRASHFENVAYFEPYYLKNFVAGAPKVKGLYS